MTVASLGIELTGYAGFDRGASALDKFAASSKKAETAATSLTTKAEAAAGRVGRLFAADTHAARFAQQIDKSNQSLTGFEAIAARAAQQAEYLARQIEQMSAHEIRDYEIQQYGQEMDRLRAKFNPLFSASKQYEASLDEINRAHALGAISAQEQGAAIARLDAQYEAAARAANTLSAANKSMAGSFHTTNMLFQLQDIGMMTALGQAPFALAMQQGPQVVGIMHQLGNSRAIIQALTGAIMGLLNPLSLATIAVIGLGAAGAQAFMAWAAEAEPARRTMEEHSEWLNKLLKGYEDLSKAVSEYMEKASRMPAALTRLEITEGLDEDIKRLRQVQSMIENFRIRDDAAFQLPWQTLNQDLDVLREIKAEFDNGILSAESFAEKMRLISMNENVDAEVRALARNLFDATREVAELEARIGGAEAALEGLTGEALRAAQAMATLNGTFAMLDAGAGVDGTLKNILDEGVASLDALRKMVPEIRSTQQIAGDHLANVLSTLPSAEARQEAQALFDTIIKNQAILDARKKESQSAARAERNPYADITRGANEFIAAQELEARTLGMTAEAAARMRYEQQLLNQAANDNIKLSPSQRQEIGLLAQAMAAAEAATNRAKEAFDFAKSSVKGFLSDLRTGLANGQSLWESFGNAALNILDKVIDKIETNLVDALFTMNSGLGGGSSGGGLFGWIGSLFGFANGGYTGNVSPSTVAGVVHGGEYVFSAAATNRIGVNNLETLHSAAKGYATGGYVQPAAYATAQPSAAAATSIVRIVLDEGLKAEIISEANTNAVQITKSMVAPVSKTVDQMAQQQRYA